FKKGAFPWVANGRSLSLGREEGFTKLLFDPDTHRVLGGGIVGTNAGDLISEIALAIETGCDAADIGLTIHPHPTLSETVAGAADAFEGALSDIYIRHSCTRGEALTGARRRVDYAARLPPRGFDADGRFHGAGLRRRFPLVLGLLGDEPHGQLYHLLHASGRLSGDAVFAVHDQTRGAVDVVR